MTEEPPQKTLDVPSGHTHRREEGGTMKAIGLAEFAGLKVLKVVDIPDLRPGLSEVGTRVHAVWVNTTHLTFRAGGRPAQPADGPPPYVRGMNVAGTVDELGDAPDGRLTFGDAVIAYVIPMSPHGGAYAERLEASVVP